MATTKKPNGVYFNAKTGNYYIRIFHSGKQYKKVIGTDKRKAELAIEEIRQDIQIKKLAGQDWEAFKKLQKEKRPKTFAEAAKDFLEERASNKASSIKSWNTILNHSLLPEFGSYALRDITESMMKKYKAGLQKSVSASRVNTIMQLLRSVMAQEYRAGTIDRDPSINVPRAPEDKNLVDPLSQDELELALANVDPHYQPLFTVLSFTGARPNEMLALRWKDIDFQKKEIVINKGRVRGAEGKPKTKSSNRTMPMVDRVVSTLSALKERDREGKVVQIDDYVFTRKNGQPIDKHLDRIWSKALAKAKLRHRSSYQLRHTFATQCIIKRLPLPFISKLLGHSTIDSLVRHYTHWIDAETKEQEHRLRESFKSQATAPSPPSRLASI